MRTLLSKLWYCQRGATALEYGLIASLIFLAIVTSVALLGTEIDALFGATGKASEAMEQANASVNN